VFYTLKLTETVKIKDLLHERLMIPGEFCRTCGHKFLNVRGRIIHATYCRRKFIDSSRSFECACNFRCATHQALELHRMFENTEFCDLDQSQSSQSQGVEKYIGDFEDVVQNGNGTVDMEIVDEENNEEQYEIVDEENKIDEVSHPKFISSPLREPLNTKYLNPNRGNLTLSIEKQYPLDFAEFQFQAIAEKWYDLNLPCADDLTRTI
jgi:hypothetical protein